MSLPNYIDKDEIRAALPLEFVCAHYGIELNNAGQALCPFHPDSSPSFRLYTDDAAIQRWHCFPCSLGGDVFDLIQRLDPNVGGFADSINRAAAIMGEVPDGWKPRVTLETPQLDLDTLTSQVNEARMNAALETNHGWLAPSAGITPAPQTDNQWRLARVWDQTLRNVFGWGVDDQGRIMLPHWDPSGNLTGCKIRTLAGGKSAVTGSRFAYLYAGWLPRTSSAVMLTEGETDCVWAYVKAQREQLQLDLRGLPRGAGADPTADQLSQLTGYKTVFLCFDADAAGVKATRKWIEALRTLNFHDVRVCRLPYGKDLRQARPNLSELIAHSKQPLDSPADLGASTAGFFRQMERGVRQVSTWTLEPIAHLTSRTLDLPPALEVELYHAGVTTQDVIAVEDMDTLQKVRRWASARSLDFLGNDSDVQLLKARLLARASVVPEAYQTNRVGIHAAEGAYSYAGRSVVLPEGNYIGDLPWRYVPGGGAADVSDRVLLPAPRRFNFNHLANLLALNEPAITTPFLAWLIASARRYEVRDFPLLFLGGSSGAGKTTLARLGLELMGSKISTNLGQATPFTLLTTMSSSTSLPVFIDEWTRMSREDAKLTLQATIPLVYEGAVAQRGRADLTMASYRMTAPIIIAGEDSMHLDREVERMILLSPHRQSQNWQAMQLLHGADLAPFAQHFYAWLVSTDDLPPFDLSAVTRPDHNRKVLETGWATLHAYLEFVSSYEDLPSLPPLDLTALDEERAAHDNVYEQAILEGAALRDPSHNYVAWADPEGRGTWVRFPTLVRMIPQRTDLELPGGAKAMKAYFVGRGYVVRSHRVNQPYNGERVRADLVHGFHLEEPTVQ